MLDLLGRYSSYVLFKLGKQLCVLFMTLKELSLKSAVNAGRFVPRPKLLTMVVELPEGEKRLGSCCLDCRVPSGRADWELCMRKMPCAV